MRSSAKSSGPAADFFKRLRSALEVLGPYETKEITAEVRSHLAEIASENGGDIDAALASFGSPEELAAGILEERGFLSAGRPAVQAPRWARLLALTLDIFVAVALLALLVVLPSVEHYWVDSPADRSLTSVWPVIVSTSIWFALLVWWWAWWRRKPGHVTFGMRLVGLRRVRMASSSALVRISDLGGLAGMRLIHRHPAKTTLWPLVFAALLALSTYGGIRSLVDTHNRQQRSREQQMVVGSLSDAQSAVMCVSQVYSDLISGAGAAGLQDYFAPQAAGVLRDLTVRLADADSASYSISGIEIRALWGSPEYAPSGPGVLVQVYVAESGIGPAGSSDYVYTVRVTPSATEAYEEEWSGVTSVRIEQREYLGDDAQTDRSSAGD